MDTYLRYIKLVLGAVIFSICTNIQGQAISVGVQIEDINIEEKETFSIAVLADTLLTDEEIYSYRFYITYNTSYLEFSQITGPGIVLSDWGMPTINASSPGTIIVAGAGATPLLGNGNMFNLEFHSLRSGGTYVSFNTSQSYWNEGDPLISFENGYVYASARSLPNIYPDNQNMFVGDEVTLSVSGGLPPYTFATTDAGIAQIINDNTLQATAPGKIKAFVTDNNGEVNYSTGLFDIRAIRMTMPDNITAWPSETVNFPLNIEIAPGTTIYSGSIDITYPSGVTATEDALQQGVFPLSFERRNLSNKVRISFASANGITGSGTLVYIPFIANTSGNHYIQYQSTIFNETLLSFNTNDYIRVNTLPVLSLTPSSGSLHWGESININVNNGTPPFSYSVSNDQVASIDNTGLLNGLSGGTTQVTVEDNLGATVTSQTFTIYDHNVSINNADGTLDFNTVVPITTSQLPVNRDLFSFEASVSFQSNYLEFIGVEGGNPQMGIEAQVEGNTILLAGATSAAISSGNVCNLLFRIKNTLNLYGSTNINFNWFKANEATLYTTLQNGAITRVDQTSYRPVADAGSDFSVDENSVAILNGSGSYDNDDDPITYLWTAPAGIVLNDATLANPAFTAPEVHVNTPLEFTLVVKDGTSDSDYSRVTVTVVQINKAPIANAGTDASYPEGASVELNGSASYDPDLQPISYTWESLDGVTLFNTSSSTPSFIAPQVLTDTEYRFRLTVSDGLVTSEADTIHVTILQVNQPPLAFAGVDLIVDEETVVQLDGSLSSDPDGESITYLWTAPPEVSLSSTTVANPTFTAPDVRLDSLLKFTLIVNDGHTDSSPDEVIIYITNTDELSSDAFIENVSLANMESFSINDINSTVTLLMPYGYDIRGLNPDFELSPWATINPPGGSMLDFTIPQTYTVTAENGTSKRDWTVSVNIPEITLSRSINAGWNWLSLSARPENSGISAIMSSLSFTDRDYIKSPYKSATWYNGVGWYGDLTEFPYYLTAQHKKATSGTWQITGKEINPTLESIYLVSGWNSLPYLLKDDADINSAIITSGIPAGNPLIKGEEGSSVYYPESGWEGDIQTLKVLHGYKFKSPYFGSLKYDPQAISSPPINIEVLKSSISDYSFSNKFEFSSTIIAELTNNTGTSITRNGDCIKAYCDGELCGQANALYIKALNRYIFILTYYCNKTNADIEFEAIQNNNSYRIDYSVAFKADDVVGEAYKPIEFVLPISTGDNPEDSAQALNISPNPASRHLDVKYRVLINSITIYNTAGSAVFQQKINSESCHINIESLADGLYFIELKLDNEKILRKFIKKVK
ncbi:PKD domain-containing protein [Plebeiibacterium marinum]|uniref:PKD domain-containing protein n=1 Tax=Plebeiibacterium marinum TaxID=2992111 RepID=A0AAE3MHM1_9BACT|nr:PKD domain-containing protein [Plebeiobacterium marinum]MCW3807822.1 PKD domain-containing protein [Plebeiobacterium marinum]